MPLQVKKVQLKLKDGNEYKDGDLLFNVDAEAWATGKRNNQEVPTTDKTYLNNAKYYAEQASNTVFNGNLAPNYSTTSAYKIGDYVVYNTGLYECTTAIGTGGDGAFNSAHWRTVKVSQLNDTIVINDQPTDSTKIVVETTNEDVDLITAQDFENIIAEEFVTNKAYTIGQYVLYNDILYKFTSAHSAGAWDSSQVAQVKIGDEVTNINDQVGDLKTQLNEQVDGIVDGLNLYKYLYKRDTFKGSDGSEVSLTGNDLYKIPLNNGDIIKIYSIGNTYFWGSLAYNYVLGIELTDETYVQITNSPRKDYAMIATNESNNYVIAFGRSNTAFMWVSINREQLRNTRGCKNFPFAIPNNQFFKVTDLPTEITDAIAIKSVANIGGGTITTLQSPFYTLTMPVKQGDKFIFNGQVGTSASVALYRNLSWEYTNVPSTTEEFTVPNDGIISILESSEATTPNAKYYPYNSKMEQVVTTEELEAAFDEELAPYPLTETVVQKRGNGKLNPGNIITNPSLNGLTNWTITDSGNGTWEVLNGDAYSKILHINTVTTNVKIVPKIDTSAEISSFLMAFKMYGVKGTGAGVQLVATGKDASNNTITIVNGIYSNVWDRTDANWKEAKLYVPLSTPLHNIAISFYTRANNYDFKFKDFYIGENTWGFPYVVDNGLDYNGIDDNTLKLTEREKTIVCFGDSITDNGFLDGTDIATEVKYKTGADTVINFGFGGCQMSQHHTNYYDPFSMYRLAYAIANNDWTLQDGVMELSPIPANAKRKIDAMKAFDFGKVTNATIEYGTNDWANGQVIENESDLFDTDTIAGALRYSIETLLTAFPHLHITVVSTAWRCVVSGGVITTDSDANTNSQGNTLPEINAKLKQIADEYHLQFIDMYNNTGFNRFTFLANYNDNIHPGSAGRKTMGDIIARHIS